MTEPTPFEDASEAVRSGKCEYPGHKPSTGYVYGCRCERCRAHRQRGRTCRVEGCDILPDKGKWYCGEHRSRTEPARRGQVQGRCLHCGDHGTFYYYTEWTFCKPCRIRYASIIRRARAHHANLPQLLAWMANPNCDLCGARLYLGKGKNGSSGFCIDHDHQHCSGQVGCADCIRGLLCNGCNMALGAYERLLSVCGADGLAVYLKG